MTYRILHCLRAPVGGLFRHVRDLGIAQEKLGHQVGIICDSNTADGLTEDHLANLAPQLRLGVHRTSMSRNIGLADVFAYRAVRDLAKELDVNVLHGHGAKGGAYARLAGKALASSKPGLTCAYTPHGGSLHYHPTSPKGRIYMAAERYLARHTDVIIFESAYSSHMFDDKVGKPPNRTIIIPNGVQPQEFEPVETEQSATDFVFVGELRHLKGVDLLLQALAILRRDVVASATIVGDGPDAQEFKALSHELGLADLVTFPGAMPAREAAFKRGRALVMPSRAESFPYIVLEAAAAAMPLIASNVGGIPEIVAGTDMELIAPDNPSALAKALKAFLTDPAAAADKAQRLRARIAEKFTVAAMTDAICSAYDAN